VYRLKISRTTAASSGAWRRCRVVGSTTGSRIRRLKPIDPVDEQHPEMLVDETKAWSYWPCRTGWIDELFRAGAPTRPADGIRPIERWIFHAERVPFPR
jgi:hypothetical protein